VYTHQVGRISDARRDHRMFLTHHIYIFESLDARTPHVEQPDDENEIDMDDNAADDQEFGTHGAPDIRLGSDGGDEE
jgi:hypothetical protein